MPDGAFAILSKAAMFSKDDAPRGRIDSYIEVNCMNIYLFSYVFNNILSY